MARIRASEGGAFESRGRFFMRVTIAPGNRPAKLVPWATSLEQADERAKAVQALVNRLRESEQTDFIENLMKSAAMADAEKMAALARAVDGIVGGKIVKVEPATANAANSFGGVLRRWTNGELARDYPDNVATKRSSETDTHRATHIPKAYQDLPVTSWRLDTYEAVMRELPKHLSSGSRRHVAQVMHRVLNLAAYPLRLIPTNPIVRGVLPMVRKTKALGALYPDETRTLAGFEGVDLGYRVLWSYLAETGWRISEAVGDVQKAIPPLRWRDVDLDHGFARLARTKTGGAVDVPVDDATCLALAGWRTLSPRAENEDRVFVSTEGDPIGIIHAAETFRAHLNAAGITREKRPDLFPEGKELGGRRPVRVHDLRALFVTISLANGATDTWVRDRTGHKTPSMLDTYRRNSRLFAKLGPLTPMVEAIPELAAAAKAVAKVAAKQFPRRDSNSDKWIQNASDPVVIGAGEGLDGMNVERAETAHDVPSVAGEGVAHSAPIRGARLVGDPDAVAARKSSGGRKRGGLL